MIRTTSKTIRDYWHLQGAVVKPGIAKAPTQGGFHRTMASAMETADRKSHAHRRGLTIQDYWRQAAPAKRHTVLNSITDPSSPVSTAVSDTAAPPVEAHQESPVAVDGEAKTACRSEMNRAIVTAARKYNLPAKLITSVIRHESNFAPRAVSSAGAQGLMQLMPATARELGVDDPFDIQQNIDGGTRYLKQMLTQFDGDLRQALAAYNAGPGTVRRYGGIPPYPETQRYVRKVMASVAESA